MSGGLIVASSRVDGVPVSEDEAQPNLDTGAIRYLRLADPAAGSALQYILQRDCEGSDPKFAERIARQISRAPCLNAC